jgi:hypothetical protein
MHEVESCKKNVMAQSTFLKIQVFWDVTFKGAFDPEDKDIMLL